MNLQYEKFNDSKEQIRTNSLWNLGGLVIWNIIPIPDEFRIFHVKTKGFKYFDGHLVHKRY